MPAVIANLVKRWSVKQRHCLVSSDLEYVKIGTREQGLASQAITNWAKNDLALAMPSSAITLDTTNQPAVP
jgi:hypothetical protein